MDICNVDRFAEALSAFKVGIFGEEKQVKQREAGKGRWRLEEKRREELGNWPPRSKTRAMRKHELWLFTLISCEIVILIWFETDCSD